MASVDPIRETIRAYVMETDVDDPDFGNGLKQRLRAEHGRKNFRPYVKFVDALYHKKTQINKTRECKSCMTALSRLRM